MIGRTNAGFGGGGGGLRIVSGLTEPVKPKENMIWVKSDKAGKKYVFAETEPENPAEGLIWFAVKTSVGIITKTKVYADAAWSAVNAYMYLKGAWIQLSNANLYVYQNGDQYTAITGGWRYSGPSIYSPSYNPNLSISGKNMTAAFSTKKKVDVTSFDKLRFTGKISTPASNGLGQGFGLSNSVITTDSRSLIASQWNLLSITNGSVDISKISGSYYIGMYTSSTDTTSASISISEVWLE